MSATSPQTISCGHQKQVWAGRYAAIDIGTVTCRMLLADVAPDGTLHEIRREYAITNLGEGVDATGELAHDAMQRVADVVAAYQRILASSQPEDGGGITTIAMATSASRDAKNADEFAAMLLSLGVELTVIPGEREAVLSFAGASCDFAGEDILVVDIGGGSTEIIAGRAGEEPLQAHSFNIGCRRVSDRFLPSDPPVKSEIEQARLWAKQGMQNYFSELFEQGFTPQRLVAVAGTATSVVSIRERMDRYDSARVHKSIVDRATLDEVYELLAGVSLADRERIVGLDPGRAPVMVAGMIILQVVVELARADSFTVSESDILHGIILEAAGNFGR